MAPDEDVYTYPLLVNRWRRERATTALTKMENGFYEGFDAHLRQLREDYTKEHAANPATPKVMILQDELTKLQSVRDDLYDLRERKIVTAALIAARGGHADHGNMTKEEQLVFEELLRTMRDARRSLLRRGQPPAVDAAKPAPSGPSTPLEPMPALVAPSAQPASALAERPSDAPAETPLPGAPTLVPREAPAVEAVTVEAEPAPRRISPPRLLVRVKSAFGPFVGPDLRHYRLAAEDVAALPKEVAHILISRGVAVAVGG